MNDCDLTIDTKMGNLWITLPDSINTNTHETVKLLIMQAITGENVKVVIDFSKTNSLFSSGLGLIILIRKKVCELNGSLCLVNVSGKIRHVLETVCLDKMYCIYPTDVEFEISQEEQFKRRFTGKEFGFIFIARMERGICRINLSGHMTIEQDLSAIHHFTLDDKVTRFIFDLTGLDLIDSAGTTILSKLLMAIHGQGGKSVAYGTNDGVVEILKIIGLNDYISFSEDEHSAIGYFSPPPIASSVTS